MCCCRRTLTRLGPSFIKAGQVLASRPDIVRADYMEELCTLQDDVPSFPDDIVSPSLRALPNQYLLTQASLIPCGCMQTCNGACRKFAHCSLVLAGEVHHIVVGQAYRLGNGALVDIQAVACHEMSQGSCTRMRRYEGRGYCTAHTPSLMSCYSGWVSSGHTVSDAWRRWPCVALQAFEMMEKELGRPIAQIFSSISERPIAAASLGQVSTPSPCLSSWLCRLSK